MIANNPRGGKSELNGSVCVGVVRAWVGLAVSCETPGLCGLWQLIYSY